MAPRIRGRGLVLNTVYALQRRGLTPPVITAESGVRLELGSDWVVRSILASGRWEPEETALLAEATPPGGVFIDVGANVGYFTLLASRWVGPAGRVYAFEPARETYARLVRNLELNGVTNVSHDRLACGATEGAAQLVAEGDPGLTHLRASGADGNGAAEESVDVTTLEAFVARSGLRRVDVLKIDVEGADFEVLRGATEMLRRFRPTVLLEVEHLARFGARPADVVAFMAPLGYVCELLRFGHSSDMICRPHERVRDAEVAATATATTASTR